MSETHWTRKYCAKNICDRDIADRKHLARTIIQLQYGHSVNDFPYGHSDMALLAFPPKQHPFHSRACPWNPSEPDTYRSLSKHSAKQR